MDKHYACKVCGYHPQNRLWWCNLGCGEDYNEMIELPESVVRQLDAKNTRINNLSDLFTCSTCGAMFDRRGLPDAAWDGVTRCSKCIEVDALNALVANLKVQNNSLSDVHICSTCGAMFPRYGGYSDELWEGTTQCQKCVELEIQTDMIEEYQKRISELETILSSQTDVHATDPCCLCGEPCEPWSGKPSRWPSIYVPRGLFGTGRYAQTHVGCLTEYIDKLEQRLSNSKQWSSALSDIVDDFLAEVKEKLK